MATRRDSSGWDKLLPAAKVPKRWADLLRLVPGYDALATAGDCRFDPDAAQRALDFFPECLRHVEGDLAGEPFRLEPWQQAVVANLLGWKRLDERGRVALRYRKALVYVARKNGKTPWMAGLGLYQLFCSGEKGQQNYIAAESREQAGKLFRHAKAMALAEPELASRCRVYGGTAQAGQSKSIVLRADETSFLQVVSAAADAQHGGNSSLVIVDELHAQPSRELIDVLTTSTASLNRKSPLVVYITTADFNRPSICNEIYDYASKVRDNLVEDPHFLPVVYEIKPADDWTAEEVWRRANPNLGVSVSLEYLRGEVKNAREIPEYENTFKRLHLNLRTDADVRWIPSLSWQACGEPFDLAILTGRDCFGGLDLANTSDLASWCLVFPPAAPDPHWYALWRFWTTEEACRERQRLNRAKFDAWVAKGLIEKIDGDTIDFGVIRERIAEDALRYHLLRSAFDPWNATQLSLELLAEGLELESFQQSLTRYNEPCKKLEELWMAKLLRHGGNKVADWMAGNVMIRTDGRGYKMPSRVKSTDKIDGICSLLMALSLAIQEPAAITPHVEVW